MIVNSSRAIFIRITAVLLGVVFALFIVELALRMLPVSDVAGSKPVNASNPVFRFQENRDWLYSKGWDFSIVNQLHSNNDGFINNYDYERSDTRPLLAVIGDSMIEARQVTFAQTLQGRLGAAVAPHGRVYSFAAAGAPLSQYLVWADYARTHYQPQGMLFGIIGNDFDESLLKYGRRPGMHFFVDDKDEGNKDLQLARVDYANTWFRQLANVSALSRYLYINLQMTELGKNIDNWLQARNSEGAYYVGNTAADTSPERFDDSVRAIDAFFSHLPEATGLPPEQILFVLDADRLAIYEPETLAESEASYFGQMRQLFMRAARTHGYQYIDLHPLFTQSYLRNQKRLEFPTDWHWNGRGHLIAADAVMASPVFTNIFYPRPGSASAGVQVNSP